MPCPLSQAFAAIVLFLNFKKDVPLQPLPVLLYLIYLFLLFIREKYRNNYHLFYVASPDIDVTVGLLKKSHNPYLLSSSYLLIILVFYVHIGV